MKKSLKSKLYQMQQFEVSGADIFGGYAPTTYKDGRNDWFTSREEAYCSPDKWYDDVQLTPNKAEGNIRVNLKGSANNGDDVLSMNTIVNEVINEIIRRLA